MRRHLHICGVALLQKKKTFTFFADCVGQGIIGWFCFIKLTISTSKPPEQHDETDTVVFINTFELVRLAFPSDQQIYSYFTFSCLTDILNKFRRADFRISNHFFIKETDAENNFALYEKNTTNKTNAKLKFLHEIWETVCCASYTGERLLNNAKKKREYHFRYFELNISPFGFSKSGKTSLTLAAA